MTTAEQYRALAVEATDPRDRAYLLTQAERWERVETEVAA